MIHIILDRENEKGLIRMHGGKGEIRSDFANLLASLYEASPDIFLEFLDVLNDFTNHLKEELENDKNNISNEGRE